LLSACVIGYKKTANGKKNKNKAKLNLTVRDEQ
jgi:hypothetical protein